MQHAGGNCRIADLVDQDETAQRPVVGIGFENDLLVGRQIGDADGVQIQRLGRQMLHRVDVDLIFGLLDRGRHGLRADLEPIGAARQHFLVRHPHDRRFELVGRLGVPDTHQQAMAGYLMGRIESIWASILAYQDGFWILIGSLLLVVIPSLLLSRWRGLPRT